MTSVHGELEVRDLGSANGIRINGQRVETGRLRPGDVLSIAHVRYVLTAGWDREFVTLADPVDQGRSDGDGHDSAPGRPAVDGPPDAGRRRGPPNVGPLGAVESPRDQSTDLDVSSCMGGRA